MSRASLATLFSVIVIDLIGFGIVIPILPFYVESYGASATALGWIITAYAGMQFLCSPLWGQLSDKIGRRPVMLITIAGSSLAMVLLGLADSIFWIIVARLLGGAFGANISVATAYATDITTEENRTRAMGLIGAAFGVGFVLGPALGGLLSTYNYHLPMFAAAGLAAVNLLYAFIILKEPPRHKGQTGAPLFHARWFGEPAVRRLCVINFLFTFGITQLEAVFAFFMMDRFHYDASQVAWILVMMALIMVGIQGGAIRKLAHRFGEKVLLVTGVGILAGAFLLIPEAGTVPLLLVPLACSAVGRGISQPATMSLVSKRAAAQRRGAVLGAFQAAASLARAVGPAVAGFLYDHTPSAPFFTGTVLMGMVAFLGWTLKEPIPHRTTLAEAELSMEENTTQL